MGRESLSKIRRLGGGEEFRRVFEVGQRFGEDFLTVIAARNEVGFSRVGAAVSKRNGSAVVRNRLKRLLREAFRKNQDFLPAGYDYVLMIRHGWFEQFADKRQVKGAVMKLGCGEVETALRQAVDRARDKGILK